MLNLSALKPNLLSILLGIGVGAVPACAQPGTAPPAGQGKTFDVVSIRQNLIPGKGSGSINLGPSPDGFHVTGMLFELILMTAYTPQSSTSAMYLGNIDNLPDWAKRNSYDIDARISDADRTAWNDPKNQPAMLQQMLQAMLVDRFKLAVHRSSKELPVYNLVVAKGGPKFQETKPEQPRPLGVALPGGGIAARAENGVRFYNFSMSLLASVLSEGSDRSVQDKTGLTGRYDLEIPQFARMTALSAEANAAPAADPRPTLFDVLKALGLKLEPATEKVERLVVDHLEKPTEN